MHTTTQSEHQMKQTFLLDVIVSKSPVIFKLIAREDKALLVMGDPRLVLDLRLEHIDGVGTLHFQ